MSYASLSNLALIEELYGKYLRDPQSVDPSWRAFFEGMDFGAAMKSRVAPVLAAASTDLLVYHLIEAYRTYGHLLAAIDPLNPAPPQEVPELDLKHLGFKTEELNTPFPTCGFLKEAKAPLSAIIEALKKTYCRTVGIEYMGLGEPAMEEWLQKRVEPFFDLNLNAAQKLEILEYLNKAELFETFIHTKYVGQKRFSLEGGETLIPMLAAMLDAGAEEGVDEAMIGMAHRGRLNVLANILNKSYSHIFHEFEDHYTPDLYEGTGDVKYHKGFVGQWPSKRGAAVKVALCANPSHLEAVNPVVEGEVRAKQEMRGFKQSQKQIVPVLIHGDAAVAGQGVIYETMQFCRLNGYSTGGTIHIVINNQIGQTTIPKDSRSTRYCTDIGKSFGAPIFHVNAEDPEACVAVAKIGMQLRQRFGCDVFIDLICYRKYGHSESDEPMFTQPYEYTIIKSKRTIREIFRDRLIQDGILDQAKAELLEKEFKASLQKAVDSIQVPPSSPPAAPPQKIKEDLFKPLSVKVAAETIISLAGRMSVVPDGFHLHPKIQRILQDRIKMVGGDLSHPAIDWGMGENLAYATLADAGIHVRLSGQDSRRGTFAHRHAVWVDQVTGERYYPLSHLGEKQGLVDVFNSPLSENAVLAFDFGYSVFYPEALVIWEAQYGDFANGAQVTIDQFIAASEQKWKLPSSICLMLPHGYEGGGPEHSSGRVERFLLLCGDDNMQVVNCTTPAQLFHLLRRQALRSIKKPLVLFTPKSMLRHPLCISSLNDFTNGSFQEILDDPSAPSHPKKLMFCWGKIYYDLVAEREKRKIQDLAIIRIEQLYPLHIEKLKAVIQKYQGFQECLWVQEEHQNMGAWGYIRSPLQELLGGKALRYAGRATSASPAAGSFALHKKQHLALIEEAFR